MEPVLNRTYKDEHDRKYNILYVDDEEVNLRVFERAFKRYYGVFTAPSGKEAIKILSENRMDLIMTDQRMPNMTGVELLLKIVPQYPNIVRMIMTGFSDEEEIKVVDEKVGLDRYLVKPWNKDDLKDEFDKALEMRYESSNGKSLEEDFDPDSIKLDLVESTLSLVETDDNPELTNEIDNLVQARKSQKRPEFVEGDINDLLYLKESLMPLQKEIQLYVDDSIIVYDHRSVNKNGYWFGECDNTFVVVSFHTNAKAIQALTLNTFINAMLTEMIYKERINSGDKIIEELSMRISVRFIGQEKLKDETVDIAVMVVDESKDNVTVANANHDFFYYDADSQFEVFKGSSDAVVPGSEPKLTRAQFKLSDVKEMYLISKNIINETAGSQENNFEALKQLLSEVRKYPMNMQRKLFNEYNYKSVIGLRL